MDAFAEEISSIDEQIEILSGWMKGVNGVIGLNFANSSNWASNANPNSASSNLSIGLNAYANYVKEKYFWRNTGIANVGWQSLDTDTNDDEKDSFLDDRTTDVLNISSLYGYRLNQDIAISGLGDLNSSVFNFLNPGSLDFGLGFTWTPHQIPDLVFVVHPLTYHIAFSGLEGVDSRGGFGTKIKGTYAHEFPGGVTWSSNLGAFFPYSKADKDAGELPLFEYTWINSVAFNVWKGIGVGITLGLRQADFEFDGMQWFNTVGLSYGF